MMREALDYPTIDNKEQAHQNNKRPLHNTELATLFSTFRLGHLYE